MNFDCLQYILLRTVTNVYTVIQTGVALPRCSAHDIDNKMRANALTMFLSISLYLYLPLHAPIKQQVRHIVRKQRGQLLQRGAGRRGHVRVVEERPRARLGGR